MKILTFVTISTSKQGNDTLKLTLYMYVAFINYTTTYACKQACKVYKNSSRKRKLVVI